MSRYKAGSKAAERRLRKHAQAMAALAAVHEQKHAAEARLAAQEAARLAQEEEARAMRVEAIRIRTEQIGPYFPVRVHAARLAAEQAAKEKAKPINTIVRDYRTRREERRAAEAAARAKPLPTAAAQAAPRPDAASGRAPLPRRHYSVTLHDRGGWWEVAVFMRRSRSFFVIPFYQTERPEAMEAHRAVIEEITTRLKMGMAAAKPRKPKAPALPSKQPRDTAKIRRIERAIEGV